MLDSLLRWWATQMLGWLPLGVRRRSGDALRADLQSNETLALFHRGTALGFFPADAPEQMRAASARFRRAATVLRLPAGTVLERDVTLPLAAERDLHSVLGYEMDRLTPFAAADLHWSAVPLRRDKGAGKLLLRLLLVPKARVAAALAALGQAGLRPVAIEAPDGRRIPLARDAAPAWEKRAVRILGAACAVLALAAVVLPFARQSARLDAADDRIAALRSRVEESEGLRRQLLAGGAERDVVVAERARLGDALGTLAAVTAVLPDDTFLLDLSLRNGELAMSGRSASAVRLIALLSADPAFRNPAFTAPVTSGDGGRDQFALRAEVALPAGAVPGR